MGKLIAIGAALLGAHGHFTAAAPPRCPNGTPIQEISVINNAYVRPQALLKVEDAMVAQSLQLRAAWGTPCVQFAPNGWAFTLQVGQITTNDDGSTSYSLAGNHFYNSGIVSASISTGGLPYTAWARAFSHEVLEALVDPGLITRWRFGLTEVCDPVENLTYQLGGIPVSDFVLPSYFNDTPGPWDQANLLAGPALN